MTDPDNVYVYLSQFIFGERDCFTADELREFLRRRGIVRIEVNRTIDDWLRSMEGLGFLKQVRPGVYSFGDSSKCIDTY